MDCTIKQCVLNASNGVGWYTVGTKRLIRSLIYHGYSGDIVTFDTFPNDLFDKSNPYHIKASALTEAIRKGYTHILWLDCSVWLIKNITPIFDIMNEKGAYLWSSGYNCAQTCSDVCLDYFGITRDEAEEIQDCSSSMLGLNLQSEVGNKFAELWLKSASDGIWNGSRLHDNQSKDKRFLFHRQDQSSASIIAYKLGIKLHQPGLSNYYPPTKETILTMQGI